MEWNGMEMEWNGMNGMEWKPEWNVFTLPDLRAPASEPTVRRYD